MKCPMCESKMKLKGFKLYGKRSLFYWCEKCEVGYSEKEMKERGEAE